MNTETAWLSVVLGFGLRLGAPALALAGMVWLMRRLDARWQTEAGRSQAAAAPPALRCWEVHACPPERFVVCCVAQHPDIPCWQQFRDQAGNLRTGCLACELFAALPARPAATPAPIGR
ncbi:MAG: hypothetical protein IT317_11350 [Anaerolineales bacterium]|nr:hypothetical protein [Anaerolineales bacterium]